MQRRRLAAAASAISLAFASAIASGQQHGHGQGHLTNIIDQACSNVWQPGQGSGAACDSEHLHSDKLRTVSPSEAAASSSARKPRHSVAMCGRIAVASKLSAAAASPDSASSFACLRDQQRMLVSRWDDQYMVLHARAAQVYQGIRPGMQWPSTSSRMQCFGRNTRWCLVIEHFMENTHDRGWKRQEQT